MLLIDIFRYFKRRADKRPVYLKNFVDQSHHHVSRPSEPSVEIIIPTRDRVDLLHACVDSIFEKTTYENYRVTIVDNQSVEPATHDYLDELENRGVKIIKFPHRFNYSAICNLAAADTAAEYLCFLNNDTQVIEPNWLGSLIDHALQPKSGVVGSLLLYPDGVIQHDGIAMGHTGLAGHANAGKPLVEGTESKCFSVSATTFACCVISKQKYLETGGLDEKFRVGLNDVDFCLAVEGQGLINIQCEKSILIHKEGATRPKPKSLLGIWAALREISRFTKVWPESVFSDRFFSKTGE